MENEKDLNKIATEDLSGCYEDKKETASEYANLLYQKLLNFMVGPTDSAENLDLTKYRDALAEILCTLSPRERDVLRIRFGMDDGRMRTLEEIAQLFGVKKDEIELIEAKALRKLRHPNRVKLLKDLLQKEQETIESTN